jgi:hypothetical protein
MENEVTNVFDTYDTEPELTYEVPTTGMGSAGNGGSGMRLVVSVAVVGGGTIGKAYADNYWLYSVHWQDELVISGDDFYSAVPKTHSEVMSFLIRTFGEAGESLEDLGDYSEYADGYKGKARECLVREWERFTQDALKADERHKTPADYPPA